MRIENDLLDIASAIRQIDEEYFLVYNQTQNRYELHNARDIPTYAMTVPFENLDYRTVELAYRTHIKNRKDLYATLDNENQKIQAQTQDKDNELLLENVIKQL